MPLADATAATGLLERGLLATGRASLMAAGAGYLLMTAVILFDIFGRRIFGVSTAAPTELTGYLLAIGMTLGLAGTLGQRAHVRIDVLVQKMPLRIRAGLHLLSLIVLLVVTGFFTYGAVLLVLESWDFQATDTSALRTPLVLPQGLWAAGFVLLFVTVAALTLRSLLWFARGRMEDIDRALTARTDRDEARETLAAAGYGDAALLDAVPDARTERTA